MGNWQLPPQGGHMESPNGLYLQTMKSHRSEDDTHNAQIRCMTHMAAMAANGLHRPWSVACPLVLYGAGLGQCNASQDAFRVDATLSSVAGVTISSAAFAAKPEGYYNGGFVRWAANGLTEHRFIVKPLRTPSRC